jgi:hypothetical protein
MFGTLSTHNFSFAAELKQQVPQQWTWMYNCSVTLAQFADMLDAEL